MIIYIEYVIIDNMVMDYILLYAAHTAARFGFKRRRLILASALGALFAAVMPLMNFAAPLLFIIKAAAGFFLVYLSRDYKSLKQYLLSAVLFFLFTFMLGGLLIGVFFMLKIDYFLEGNFYYISKIPAGFVFFGAFLLFLVIKRTAFKLYRKKNVQSFVYKCRLSLSGVSVNVRGFLDSGNRLYFKRNLPVIITGANVASALFKEGLFCGGTSAQYLEFQTVAGSNKMMVFAIDYLEIYIGGSVNIIDNIMLGISPYHIKGEEEYDLILHPAVLQGG